MDMSRFNGLPSLRMSVHSYSRCWVHLIWGTLNRESYSTNRLLPTLRGKRNIVGCAPSRKSFGNLSSAMAYAGRMRKAVETAYVHRGGGCTGLKAGVNESVPSGSSR